MKSVRYYGIEDVRFEDIERTVAQPGHALVRILYGGICGSDLHIYRAGMFMDHAPETMGHEFVGEIAEAPEGCGFQAGDMVTGDPRVICGKCPACEADRTQSCYNLGFIGEVSPGCFAEYLSIAPKKLIKIAKTVDPKQAALAEPLAVAVHAVRSISDSGKKRALVAGAGPIGLLISYLLKEYAGFTDVAVADIDEYRRGIADKIGIKKIASDVAELIAEYPLLVDVVGVEKVFDLLVKNAKPGTEIHVSAIYEKTPVIDLNTAVSKELRIFGDNCYAFPDLQEAVSLLESGKYDFSWLVSRVLPAEQAAEGFKLLVAPEKKDMKILFTF
jgi:Threonine dehydrogenase and related Zn-dependent dehydrogenases